MWAIFKIIGCVLWDAIASILQRNRDEQIGALKEDNREQAKVIDEASEANEVANNVSNMSDHARNKLSKLLNDRD